MRKGTIAALAFVGRVMSIASWFFVAYLLAEVAFAIRDGEVWSASWMSAEVVVISWFWLLPQMPKLGGLKQGKRTIYAWRSWRLHERTPPTFPGTPYAKPRFWASTGTGKVLSSATMSEPWPRGVMVAECRCFMDTNDFNSGDVVVSEVSGFAHHYLRHAPCEDGMCGIYARKFPTHLPQCAVVGIVALGGRVVKATEGYRAEKAMPVALFCNALHVSEQQAQEMADWYEVPVQRGVIWTKRGKARRWVRKAGKQIAKEASAEDDRFHTSSA